MIEVRCTNYGNCRLDIDDGKTHTYESLEHLNCPLQATGECCAVEEKPKNALVEVFKGAFGSRMALFGALGVAGIGLIGGAGYGAYNLFFATPSCEVTEVKQLLELDPKLGELEKTGSDCLTAGLANADSDQIVYGTIALRTAFDKGSPIAGFLLGRMFDPLQREELEAEAAQPDLLPAVDAAEALRFYDAVAELSPEAEAAAAALREKYPELSASAAGKGNAPLAVPGHTGLYRRILTKPGAVLVERPGQTEGRSLPALGIFYVFEAREGWYRIGETLANGAAGWVNQAQVQDWPVMMVMRYTPPDGRQPALFFRDEIAIKSILGRPGVADEVQALLASAGTDQPDPRLVAIEDRTVDWASSPYLMPILATSPYVNDSGRTMFLAKVGSVTTGGSSVAAGAQAGSCARGGLGSTQHQIVFVIDTTASMGPYIEGVRRIADYWANEVERRQIGDKVRFGLVAYRNNMDDEPQRSGLEYVSRVVLPLSASSDARAFADAIGGLSAAKVSTHSFNEDAVAGLDDALRMNWGPNCGTRLLFHVTDAGSLQSDDPKASRPGIGLSTIAATAREMDISIFPVHVLTREARAAGNTEVAADQYRSQLSDGRGTALYRAISAGSTSEFQSYLKEVSVLLDALGREAKGELVKSEEIGAGDRSVSELVLGKLFSVQQKFLGESSGSKVPTFSASWTSDRDLADPDRSAFDVSVFLTRQQLGQLAERCQVLIANARQAKTESSRFFDLLRTVSAATAQDPKRFFDRSQDLSSLMPSFLGLLPYKSDVLALTAEDWRTMGAEKQDAFIRRLNEKLAFYRKIESDQSQWIQLAGSSQADQVALIPLSEMP